MLLGCPFKFANGEIAESHSDKGQWAVPFQYLLLRRNQSVVGLESGG